MHGVQVLVIRTPLVSQQQLQSIRPTVSRHCLVLRPALAVNDTMISCLRDARSQGVATPCASVLGDQVLKSLHGSWIRLVNRH